MKKILLPLLLCIPGAAVVASANELPKDKNPFMQIFSCTGHDLGSDKLPTAVEIFVRSDDIEKVFSTENGVVNANGLMVAQGATTKIAFIASLQISGNEDTVRTTRVNPYTPDDVKLKFEVAVPSSFSGKKPTGKATEERRGEIAAQSANYTCE